MDGGREDAAVHILRNDDFYWTRKYRPVGGLPPGT